MYGVRQQPNNRVGADLLRFLVQCEVFWKPLNTNVRLLKQSVIKVIQDYLLKFTLKEIVNIGKTQGMGRESLAKI
jgi:hypothetical protein